MSEENHQIEEVETQEHKEERVQNLMQEIDEKINLFISLTNSKGKAVKQKWRKIKKQRTVKDV